MAIAGKSVPAHWIEWRNKERKNIRIVHAQNVLDWAVQDDVHFALTLPGMVKGQGNPVWIRSYDAQKLRNAGYIVRSNTYGDS